MGRVDHGLVRGLLIATAAAGVLRFAALSSVPVALYCDEAFAGYEAYSLLQTGRDSRGVLLPLFFDIFGVGWGEPLYIYLTVPAVALFGLTPFSARFVAAVAGTIAVPMTGMMTHALLRDRLGDRSARVSGVAAAGLMAISPWAFHFSRIAFQASLLPPMLAAGVWLAVRGIRRPGGDLAGGAGGQRAGSLLAAAVLLGGSLWTYTIARLATPLIVGGFIIAYRKRLIRSPRAAIAAGALLLIAAVPIYGFSLTERGRQRFSDVSILSRSEASAGWASAGSSILSNYVSYYTPRFLLLDGDDNRRHGVEGHGMLHPHEILLLLIGVAVCAGAPTRGGVFLLWWLAVFPAAASLTIDPRHAVRSLCALPGIYALAGAGAATLWRFHSSMIRRRMISAALLGLMLAAAAVSVIGYFHHYYTRYPVYSGPSWQYGLKETYAYLRTVEADHDSIYITRNEDYPYIHLLFFRAFPPREYQQHGLSRTPYLFDQEMFYKGPRIPGRLDPIFVWKPFEVPEAGVQARQIVHYPDGSEAFVIAW